MMTVACSRWPQVTASLLCACLLYFALSAFATGADQPRATAASESRDASDEGAAFTEPLLSRIEAEETRNGSFSRDLIEPLIALGLAYQEIGEHALALGVFDRAFYLQRFNEGLYTLDQVPLVRRLIESEIAVGRPDQAAALEQRLLELARRHPDDVRGVRILREAAERQLDYYERYLRRDLPFAIVVNDPDGPSRAAAFSLRRARIHYEEAIATLMRSGGYAHDELAELEEGLTRAYYLEANSRQPVALSYNELARLRWADQRANLYGLGRISYERRVGYAARSSPTAYETARALVELADWSIVFSRNGAGIKDYEKAHALLVAERAPATAIEELFPTDVPVFLPTFLSNPLRARASAESSGYVDFDFEIGRYGQPRKTRIVAVAGDHAATAAKAIVATIGRSRFRPSPFAETERATTYRLRYSLADGALTPRS